MEVALTSIVQKKYIAYNRKSATSVSRVSTCFIVAVFNFDINFRLNHTYASRISTHGDSEIKDRVAKNGMSGYFTSSFWRKLDDFLIVIAKHIRRSGFIFVLLWLNVVKCRREKAQQYAVNGNDISRLFTAKLKWISAIKHFKFLITFSVCCKNSNVSFYAAAAQHR